MSKAFPIDEIIAYENDELEEEQEAFLMQKLINSGAAWGLQGSYGRTAMEAIRSGVCMLGLTGHKDSYGNYVPGRDEVEPGTKGSAAFVEAHRGKKWAKNIGKIK